MRSKSYSNFSQRGVARPQNLSLASFFFAIQCSYKDVRCKLMSWFASFNFQFPRLLQFPDQRAVPWECIAVEWLRLGIFQVGRVENPPLQWVEKNTCLRLQLQSPKINMNKIPLEKSLFHVIGVSLLKDFGHPPKKKTPQLLSTPECVIHPFYATHHNPPDVHRRSLQRTCWVNFLSLCHLAVDGKLFDVENSPRINGFFVTFKRTIKTAEECFSGFSCSLVCEDFPPKCYPVHLTSIKCWTLEISQTFKSSWKGRKQPWSGKS